jgi:hypothetical protein
MDYVPRQREKLVIDDDRWGRMCAEHALPLGWESMPYEEFLRDRRQRMADIIHVAFRQLGGESNSPPLTPPWFMPGAEAVWRIDYFSRSREPSSFRLQRRARTVIPPGIKKASESISEHDELQKT